MPGIDFDRVRAEITIREVLPLLGFQATRRRGDQWYGRCPLPGCSPSPRSCFSVNVHLGRYHCHRCHRYGHQLELWATARGLPLHQADNRPLRRIATRRALGSPLVIDVRHPGVK